MLKIFLAYILNDFPFLIPTINLSLSTCTMRAFRLTGTEKKLIYLVLANVTNVHNCHIYHSLNVIMAACLKSLSFQQIFSLNEKKALYCFIFLSFFI